MTQEEMIERYGPQVRSFIASEAADVVFSELDARYFAEFKAALTDDDRRTAWAKSRALEDVWRTLQTVVDAADIAMYTAQRRAKAATA